MADADIVPGPGGVMTDEVGVVTGELTLRSELVDGHVVLRVQYKDAEEWYAVTGGKAALKDPADLDAVHAIAVGLLNRPEAESAPRAETPGAPKPSEHQSLEHQSLEHQGLQITTRTFTTERSFSHSAGGCGPHAPAGTGRRRGLLPARSVGG